MAHPETLAISDSILIALQKNKDINDKTGEIGDFIQSNQSVSADKTTLYLFSAFMQRDKAIEKKLDAETHAINHLIEMVKKDLEHSKEIEKAKEAAQGDRPRIFMRI